MIGVDKGRLPYNQTITYPMVKYIRMSRNLTQHKFGQIAGIEQSTLAKIESGIVELSPHYETKIRQAVRQLRVSNYELDGIRKLLEYKSIRGYRH
jgi:transcriptional regulator with XRE-family HTH domain